MKKHDAPPLTAAAAPLPDARPRASSLRSSFLGAWPKQPVRQPRGSFARPGGSILTVQVEDEGRRRWPTVRIRSQAHGKMRALIEACPMEISWIAACTRNGDDVEIDDVFVQQQLCSNGFTFVTRDGEAELLNSLLAAHRIDVIRRLNCWGHSHVDSMVFASGTDESQTQELIARAKDMGKDFFVRLIANKWDDLFATLYLFDQGLIFQNVPLHVEPPKTWKWRAWAEQEVALKARKIRLVRTRTEPGKRQLIAAGNGAQAGASRVPTIIRTIGAKNEKGGNP